MRRLLLLLAAAGLAVWVRSRHRARDADRVTIGYADGSAIALAPGEAARDALIGLARETLVR